MARWKPTNRKAMARPNVNISLGNGNMGRSAATADGVAGMVLTGVAVAGKLELNKQIGRAHV